MGTLSLLLGRLRLQRNLRDHNLAMCFRALVHLRICDKETIEFIVQCIAKDVHHSTRYLHFLKALLNDIPRNTIPLGVFMAYLPLRAPILNLSHVHCIAGAIVQSKTAHRFPDAVLVLASRTNDFLHLIDMGKSERTDFIRLVQYIFLANEPSIVPSITKTSDDFIQRYQKVIDSKVSIFLCFLKEIAKHQTLMAEYHKTGFVLLEKSPQIRAFDIRFITGMLYKYRFYLPFDLWDRWLREIEQIDFTGPSRKLLNVLFYFPGEVWGSVEHRRMIDRISLEALNEGGRGKLLPHLSNLFVFHVRHDSAEESSRRVIQIIAEALASNLHRVSTIELYSIAFGIYKLNKKSAFLASDLATGVIAAVSDVVETFTLKQLTRIAYMFARGAYNMDSLLEKICRRLFEQGFDVLELRDINFLLFSLTSAYKRGSIKLPTKKILRFAFSNLIDRGESLAERGNFFRHALTLFTRMGFSITEVVDYSTTILDEIVQTVKPVYVLDILATLTMLSSSADVHRKAFDAFKKCYDKLPVSKYKLLTAILSTPTISSPSDIQFFSTVLRDLTRCRGRWEHSYHILSVMRKVNSVNIHMPFEMNALWDDLCVTFHGEMEEIKGRPAMVYNRFRIFVAGLGAMRRAKCQVRSTVIETAILAALADPQVEIPSQCLGMLLRSLQETVADALTHRTSTVLCERVLMHVAVFSAADLGAALHCITHFFSIGDVNRRELCESIMDALCVQLQETCAVTLAYGIIADFSAISMPIRSNLLRKLLIGISDQSVITSESPAIDFIQYLVTLDIDDRGDPLLREFIGSLLVRTLRVLLSFVEVSERGCARVLYYLTAAVGKYPKIDPYLEAFRMRVDRKENAI